MHALVCSAGVGSVEGKRLHSLHVFPCCIAWVCVGHFVAGRTITVCRPVRYSTGERVLGVCHVAVLGKYHCGSL